MRIAITGSTSSIGMRLSEKLDETGHTTFGLGGSKSKLWQLGDEFPQELEADLLIHLAHDRTLSLDKNIAAAKSLCTSFGGNKLFLSSFSAHSKSRSIYGKSKYEIEKVFAETNGCSLRAGIVYGGNIGGIFAQLTALLEKSLCTPVPYRGLPLLFTTHIDDLISEIIWMVSGTGSNTVFAAHPYPISLIELLRHIGAANESSQYYFRLPRQPFDLALRLLIRIMPNFPMADSLLSLSSSAIYEELSGLQIPQSKFRAFNLKNEI